MELDTGSIATIIVAVVAIAVAVFSAIRSNQTITVETVTDMLSDIEIAAGAAKEWVLAAEQLWLTGQLEKDARFHFVLHQLKAIYPDIDDNTLEGSIEAAVAWLHMLRGRKVGLEG
jgi:hypothetical protein